MNWPLTQSFITDSGKDIKPLVNAMLAQVLDKMNAPANNSEIADILFTIGISAGIAAFMLDKQSNCEPYEGVVFITNAANDIYKQLQGDTTLLTN